MSVDTLRVAAQGGDINSLKIVLKQDPYVLEHIESIPCIDTPLHVAASAGHLELATDIMILKPSFALKLNLEGFTPLHLALQHGHKKIVIRLVDFNKELVRVKGKDGLTPLHLASQIGEDELLDEFLKACPNSIEDMTVRRETALHIAVSHQHYKALKVLVDWLMRNFQNGAIQLRRTILNWKDEEGNTILHAAAFNNDIEAISLLMKSPMNLDAKNLADQTALEIATNEDFKGKLVGWAAKRTTFMWKTVSLINMREHISEEARNAYFVVAALVATATYQSALSPPGGFHQIDSGTNNTLSHAASFNSSTYEGKSIMSNGGFILFSTMNMGAFLASTFAIIYLLPKNVASIIFALPIGLLQLSYYFSVLFISPTLLAFGVVYVIFIVLFTILWFLVRVLVIA